MSNIGLFHIGDMCNVMRHGTLVQALEEAAAPVHHPVLLATVTGAICTYYSRYLYVKTIGTIVKQHREARFTISCTDISGIN